MEIVKWKVALTLIFVATLYRGKSSEKIAQCKATITQYDLSHRFFCIDATSLFEFENDKVWVNEFE